MLEEDQGGDAACWIANVCPECGLLVEEERPRICPRCGAPFPDVSAGQA